MDQNSTSLAQKIPRLEKALPSSTIDLLCTRCQNILNLKEFRTKIYEVDHTEDIKGNNDSIISPSNSLNR